MKILSLCLCILLTFPFGEASLFRLLNPTAFDKKIPPISTDFREVTQSILNSFSSSKSISYDELDAAVDYSTEAVITRLKIYIKGNDPSAVFCELKGNRSAASLNVFNGITNDLLEILHYPTDHEMLSDSHRTPVGFVCSIFSVFIKFGVNISQADVFFNFEILELVIDKLKSHHRPLLAFFILLEDYSMINEISRKENINFYAVNNAILVLPNAETKIEILSIIYDHFNSDILMRHKIPQRLYRDALDFQICQLIVSHGYNPPLFTRSSFYQENLEKDHFAEICVYNHETDCHFKKRNSAERKKTLPFVLYPLKDENHPRWALYSLAYGDEIVQSHKPSHPNNIAK